MGSMGISNAGFGAMNTAQLGNKQFSIQQGLERQYGGMSAIATLAMNNPEALENPQLMKKLQLEDKQFMLQLEQDKIMAAVYDQLGAEQKRLKKDPHNSKVMLV